MIKDALLITWAALSALSIVLTIPQIGKERKPINPTTATIMVSVNVLVILVVVWVVK
jgi:uncharacterized membrane protein